MKAVGKHPKKHFVVVLALFAKLDRFGPPEVGLCVNMFLKILMSRMTHLILVILSVHRVEKIWIIANFY